MQLITGTTKLLGIIGDPVEHSFSPIMHNQAIASLGADYIYVPLPVKSANLKTALAGFSAIGLQGFSVTIPHKQAIIPLLSEVSNIGQLVGAVNTIYPTAQGWGGTNTDVAGFIAPLQAYQRDWSKTVVVVLGYGGAARAVVVGCSQLGCTDIHIVGRNPSKLSQFQQSWDKTSLPITLNIHPWQKLPELVPQAELLINTTPLGMSPQVDQSPVSGEILSKLQHGAIAYDLVYTPNPTKFLQEAKQQGAITIDGLEMLVEQGAAALKIWLRKKPPVEVMRQSLHQYLGL